MAGFNAINAQERVDSADLDWTNRALADKRYQADATKTRYTPSTVAGWSAQGLESSSSRGPLAAHMAAEDVNYKIENDLCDSSQDPYLQDHQYSCDADNELFMATQELDDNHEMPMVPPFAYDRATTRLTYCAGDNAFNGLDDMALLDNTMASRHQSHLRGHEGLRQSNDGATDQHFSTGQQFSTGDDIPQDFPGSFQCAQDVNDSRADQNRYGVVEDFLNRSWEVALEGNTPAQDDEEVPSLLQQARDEDLCQDYLTHDPMRPFGLPTSPLEQIDDVADPYLTAAIDTFNKPRMLERWEVDTESASFLAHLAALGKDDGNPMLLLKEAYQDFSDLRVVEPLLRRDPEQELQVLKLKNAVTISTRGIQPFGLDVEKDEAMDWPTAAAGLPSEKITDARNEKLEVGRDVILYLKEIMDLPALDPQEALNVFLEEVKPHHAPIAMTPPLLPLSPLWNPPHLPASMHQMPLTSSPEDLIARDLAEVDQSIRRMDENSDLAPHGGMKGLGQGTIDPKLLYSGLNSLEHTSSPKEMTRRLPQLEVEVPLLPQSSTGSELWQIPTTQSKALSLQEVQSLISDPDADLSIFDPDFAEKDLQAYVNDELMPIVEAINDSVRNDSLEEFDTTIRVPVPTSPANEPTAPWRMYTRSGDTGLEFEAQRALMGYTKRELLRNEDRWGGVSKLERALHWSPFPARLGKANLVKEIDDDKSASRYMADLELEGEFDITSLVTKVDGLRLLDPSDSDDEELQPAAFDDEEFDDSFTQPQHNPETQKLVARGDEKQDPKPIPLIHAPSDAAPLLAATRPSKDTGQVQLPLPVQTHDKSLPQPKESDRPSMSTLLLKRKLELEQNSQQGAVTLDAADCHETKRKRFRPSRVSDLFEAGGLAGFMGLQGMQADKPIQSIHQQPQPIEPPAPAAAMVAPAVSVPPPIFRGPLPSPVIAKPTRQMQIVTCTQVISDRALVRGLQTMLPNLDMVERDAISAAHGAKHTEAIAITEADISLSPAAGLVVTTLQKLKQRRLPGQTAFFGVRERISMVASRYEKLIVLVSEGRQLEYEGQSPGNALDLRDCDALADFMAFALTLQSDVEVRYVPGGEIELIRWIAALISECTTSDDLKLLPDETLWERFLRTAGMNVFAAQAVLGQLKGPDLEGRSELSSMPSHSAKRADSGLAAFVRSSAEARVHRFSQMLGGDRVLSRVARAIDGPWTNAGDPRGKV